MMLKRTRAELVSAKSSRAASVAGLGAMRVSSNPAPRAITTPAAWVAAALEAPSGASSFCRWAIAGEAHRAAEGVAAGEALEDFGAGRAEGAVARGILGKRRRDEATGLIGRPVLAVDHLRALERHVGQNLLSRLPVVDGGDRALRV